MMASNHQLGRHGERLAERHYRRDGYRILARNLIVHRREIDLLARTPDATTLVIVEVKTSTRSLHKARSALDQRKRRRLVRPDRICQRQLPELAVAVAHGHFPRPD